MNFRMGIRKWRWRVRCTHQGHFRNQETGDDRRVGVRSGEDLSAEWLRPLRHGPVMSGNGRAIGIAPITTRS